MRETLFFSSLLLLCSIFCSDAHGQSVGPISISGTQCVSVSASSKATVAFQMTGSWSGTIQPQAAIAGQTAVNVPVTPSTSTTQQATVTGNGAFWGSISGYSTFLLCGASITGTAKVYINLSPLVH
jgi:hypothetical protein